MSALQAKENINFLFLYHISNSTWHLRIWPPSKVALTAFFVPDSVWDYELKEENRFHIQPQTEDNWLVYILKLRKFLYIRPQTEENWASRPLCHTQASDRQISSWVGDHQRIPVVVCNFLGAFFFGFLFLFKLKFEIFCSASWPAFEARSLVRVRLISRISMQSKAGERLRKIGRQWRNHQQDDERRTRPSGIPYKISVSDLF